MAEHPIKPKRGNIRGRQLDLESKTGKTKNPFRDMSIKDKGTLAREDKVTKGRKFQRALQTAEMDDRGRTAKRSAAMKTLQSTDTRTDRRSTAVKTSKVVTPKKRSISGARISTKSKANRANVARSAGGNSTDRLKGTSKISTSKATFTSNIVKRFAKLSKGLSKRNPMGAMIGQLGADAASGKLQRDAFGTPPKKKRKK